MLGLKTIAVVVPAFNEEQQIGMVIETMPDFVDRIVIVNDCSKDKTSDIVQELIKRTGKRRIKSTSNEPISNSNKYRKADIIVEQLKEEEIKKFTPFDIFNNNSNDDRIILINHKINAGVGAAIATGYKWCKDNEIDCTAVMAGDGQMDPAELESICKPVVEENIDYVKGNRLIHRSAWLVIPKMRYFGNSILSILTKIASGYWHISDTQTGYTAISKKAMNAIRLYKIFKGYGMPNDMLVKLNIAFCTIKEVEIKPVYNIGEKTKMKIIKVIPKISWLLFRLFFKRLWTKYLLRDFHPLFILYHMSFVLFILSIPSIIIIFKKIFTLHESIPDNIILIFSFLFISGFQSLLFAMWMDIQDNERLYK